MSRLGALIAVLAALVVGVPLAGGTTTDQPPQPTILLKPPDPSNSNSATFAFTDADPAATFACRLDSSDDSSFSLCVSPQTYPGLSDGSHTFEVRAVDALMSDPSEVALYTWTIDTAV